MMQFQPLAQHNHAQHDGWNPTTNPWNIPVASLLRRLPGRCVEYGVPRTRFPVCKQPEGTLCPQGFQITFQDGAAGFVFVTNKELFS